MKLVLPITLLLLTIPHAAAAPDLGKAVECVIDPPPEDPRCLLRAICNEPGCVGAADGPRALPCDPDLLIQCVRYACDTIGWYGCVGSPPPRTDHDVVILDPRA